MSSQTLAAGIVLICGWLYFTMFLTDGDIRLSQLGLTCSVVTVSMYLSPLTDLVQFTPQTNTTYRQRVERRLCLFSLTELNNISEHDLEISYIWMIVPKNLP